MFVVAKKKTIFFAHWDVVCMSLCCIWTGEGSRCLILLCSFPWPRWFWLDTNSPSYILAEQLLPVRPTTVDKKGAALPTAIGLCIVYFLMRAPSPCVALWHLCLSQSAPGGQSREQGGQQAQKCLLGNPWDQGGS